MPGAARGLIAVALILILPVLMAPRISAQEACRQALALALDVSGSVNAEEYRAQLDGLAGALNDPDVRDALLALPAFPVRLNVFEWSGVAFRRQILPWTPVTSDEALDRIIEQLRQTRRVTSPATTAIGAAMEYTAIIMEPQSDCWKRTLDISGDGQSNEGFRPRDIIDSGTMAGLTVNALVIGTNAPTGDRRRLDEISRLTRYFKSEVIFGDDAFVETALGYDDYQRAMRKKLLRELSEVAIGQANPGTGPRQARFASTEQSIDRMGKKPVAPVAR